MKKEVLIGYERVRNRKRAPLDSPGTLALFFPPLEKGQPCPHNSIIVDREGDLGGREETKNERACHSLHVATKLSATSILGRIQTIFILHSENP